MNGNRVRKTIVGGSSTYYINGYDGKTEVVSHVPTGSDFTYNIWGNDLIGQVRVVGTTATRYYYLKDHLGNIRMTVNSAGNAVSWDDYYPSGSVMPGRSQISSADNRYKFTGKERDTETNYDYFGARYYDSRIGRWLQVDPLANKYPDWSPYNYTLNNPCGNIDPNGKEPITLTGVAVVATGAVGIALVGHTYNYFTNPSYKKAYDSFSSSILKVSGDTFNDILSSFSSWLNSETNTTENTSSGGAQTKEELEKAKDSYENLINEHKEKLEQYKNDPESGDNKNTLKNAKPEHKEKIIQGRIKAIEKQISKQQRELDKIIEALNEINE